MKRTPDQKKLYELIDEVLWQDWDPIGINDIEEVRDEYKSYTSHIFSMTIQGADKMKIAEYLYHLETKSMGLTGDINNCERVAQKILELNCLDN